MSCSDKKYKNLLPPLVSLSDPEEKELLTKLENLDFLPNKGMAA